MNLAPALPLAAEPFLRLSGLLRESSFSIAPEQVTAFLASVSLLGPCSIEDIRQAGIATLAPSPDRMGEYDAIFRAVFFGDAVIAAGAEDEDDETRVKDSMGREQQREMLVKREKGGALSSGAERLSTRELDGGAEEGELRQFRRSLGRCLPRRRSFRYLPTRLGGHIDLRRSLREIVRADGDIPDLRLRKREIVLRRIVLLIDISGSMKQHTLDHLKVAHAVVQGAGSAEVFTFGTRLTRLTSALRIRDRAQALEMASRQAEDWDGGTRIGPALLAFLAVPRFSSMARGAAVVVLSDGLERGAHQDMETAMRRLSARAFRLSLCTPLAGDRRFRPVTAALRAILPILDDLVDGSSIATLADFILSLDKPAPRAEAIWGRNADAGHC
ncbi:VWA domain-containing protein [Sinorhizobium sp. BG8]|uniref:vWA domain-containing protein n=1 Tax=Sinorhizobium sp. BG8 TaxID=2613773 RepID=UPI00193E2DB5|nr:VWA domain-containing protein [Sinorhizobium sp. BG8]QRM57402.1 VWA domain-containing protein [Sinorhizobium sp. BG8]